MTYYLLIGLSYQLYIIINLLYFSSITLVGSIPKAGIRFGANAKCKKLLADENGKLTMGKPFLAGMGAGIVEAVLAVTPMETIKTHCIEKNMSLRTGVADILQKEGLTGVYKGVSATILKQASNQGLRFMIFNTYKEMITNDGARALSPIESLLGGMLAGCLSVLGNNPFDVVKTRMQGSDSHMYKNTLDCFVSILKHEGPMGYYKGALARMGRVVPGQGIIFMSFEVIQSFLEKNTFLK